MRLQQLHLPQQQQEEGSHDDDYDQHDAFSFDDDERSVNAADTTFEVPRLSLQPDFIKSGLELSLKRLSINEKEKVSIVMKEKGHKYQPMHAQYDKEQLKSSIQTIPKTKSKVVFNKRIEMIQTWSNDDYDRINPDMKRVQRMIEYYPRELIPMRKEINALKAEMDIHPDSRCNTNYLLV